MDIISNNSKRNKNSIIKSLTSKVANSTNNPNYLTPFLKFIKNLSPIHFNTIKYNFPKNTLKKIANMPYNSSLVNTNCFNINGFTINHTSNLTNLNVYLLYNPDNFIGQNKSDFKDSNIKEPKDTIRRKILKLQNNPYNKTFRKTQKFPHYNSVRYSFNKNVSSSSLNNFDQHFQPIKVNKYNKIKEKNHYTFKTNNPAKPKVIKYEPKGILKLSEFEILEQIGKGTYGKIFSVNWKEANKKYALKKETFNDYQYVEKRENIMNIIKNFLEKTKNKGITKIYSNLYEKINNKYIYYELMEIGDKDWEKEINSRRLTSLYYTEDELFNISFQLIKTLSLLQKNHITHRDIKPQNILIISGKYKLCDFGEIRIMKKEGTIVQRIRGSELFMSPILFYGLRANLTQVKHNTYKSDVFSFGMCLFYAATLFFNCIEEIREISDTKYINPILNKYLSIRYSQKFINLIDLMLRINEDSRPDFIELEDVIYKLLNN